MVAIEQGEKGGDNLVEPGGGGGDSPHQQTAQRRRERTRQRAPWPGNAEPGWKAEEPVSAAVSVAVTSSTPVRERLCKAASRN